MDRYWRSMVILIYLNYGTSKLIKGISLQKYEQKKEHVRLRMIEGNQSIKQYIKHRFWKRCHFEVVDFPSAGGWRWCSSQGDQQLMSVLAWPWGDSFLYQNMVINAYIYMIIIIIYIYIYYGGNVWRCIGSKWWYMIISSIHVDFHWCNGLVPWRHGTFFFIQ